MQPNNSSVKTGNTSNSEKKKGPGKIEFVKEFHNFGTIREGETVAFSFVCKNSGGAPFRLLKVEPGCGCISVGFDQNEINVQETSIIEVVFHSEGEWGNQIKMVNIETSAGEFKTLTIGAFIENRNFNIDLNK
jgi:hypothetical protein